MSSVITSTSDRGMFDPNLPLQGIFDTAIFDTDLVTATVTQILIPAFVHGTSEKTALLHSTELIVVK
jgi:hypothetical protein